jgi:hypothetical protein
MARLLGDAQLRAQFAHNARAVALERFDWAVLATRLGSGLAPFDHFATNPVP